MEPDTKVELELPLFGIKACPSWSSLPRSCSESLRLAHPFLLLAGKTLHQELLITVPACLQPKLFSFSL